MIEHRPPRPTDGVSVAALVAGVVGCGPVAFALGAVGLHRTGRGAPGRGFAVAGVVLGGLQMLAISATALTLAGLALSGAAVTTWLPGWASTTTTVSDLRPGDCFDPGADAGLDGGVDGGVDSVVDRTDCAQRHDGEVLEVVTLPDGDYPGSSTLQLLATDRCATDAETAVDAAGLDPADFEVGYSYPLEQNWADGSRTVQCTIHGWAGDLQGSVLDGTVTLRR